MTNRQFDIILFILCGICGIVALLKATTLEGHVFHHYLFGYTFVLLSVAGIIRGFYENLGNFLLMLFVTPVLIIAFIIMGLNINI